MTEYFQTSIEKAGRGRSAKSIGLIDAMYEIAEAARPISGRGVGYKLFSMGLTPDMSKNTMQGVYRLLKEAREDGTIPWDWIVDESRQLEKVSSWDDAADYMKTVSRAYRKDFWQKQPERVEVWSEKGTVRGVLRPLLDEYGVGFRVMHGFGGAGTINDMAQDNDGRPLTILYVGDYDPSGMWMSERDIPERLERYANLAGVDEYVTVERIALLGFDCDELGKKPAFNVREKKKDPRAPWFKKEYGQWCWELDAMDQNDLRERVEQEINSRIEPVAWARCKVVDEAERNSMASFLAKWKT